MAHLPLNKTASLILQFITGVSRKFKSRVVGWWDATIEKALCTRRRDRGIRLIDRRDHLVHSSQNLLFRLLGIMQSLLHCLSVIFQKESDSQLLTIHRQPMLLACSIVTGPVPQARSNDNQSREQGLAENKGNWRNKPSLCFGQQQSVPDFSSIIPLA